MKQYDYKKVLKPPTFVVILITRTNYVVILITKDELCNHIVSRDSVLPHTYKLIHIDFSPMLIAFSSLNESTVA